MQNVLPFFKLVVLIVCSLVTFTCQSRADSLKDVFQTASQMPSLLKGYQFSFVLRGISPDSTKYQKVDISQSGNNIRVKSVWVLPEETKVDPLLEPVEYAFNGIDYQWFVTGPSALTLSKKCRHPTPYWTPSPLMWPYYWIAGQQTNWSDIKDLVKWNARFKEAQYIGQRVEDGILFEIVSFPFPQMNMDRVHVYFAKSIDYYPLMLVGYKDGLNKGLPVLKARVVQYKVFDVDGTSFVFPLNVEVHIGTDEEGVLGMYWTVDESSITVNPQLDEDLFIISPSRAMTVTDMDVELESGRLLPSFDIADDGRDIVHAPLAKRSWSLSKKLLIGGNLAFLFVLLVYYFWRKRFSRKGE